MGFEYTEKAVDEGEPQIIRAARMFDDAQNDLENLQQQHRKISEAIKGAQERMNEAAANIRSCIDISAVSAEVRKMR